MSEIADFALILLPITGGVALAILSTRLSARLPIPAPGIFLVAAAVVSDLVGPVRDALSIHAVERIAVVALVIILLDGGMDIGWRRMRETAWPVVSLGVLGTFATAGALAVAAHFVLGFGWTLAGIVGAALAPTDPAVMFSVLGGRELRGRSRTILEGEAGVNDPASIALMLGLIELATHEGASFAVVVSEFALEMAIGVVAGAAAGPLLAAALRLCPASAEALRPVLVVALALVLYAVTAALGGSGFVAVFIAGLVLGDARVPLKRDVERFSKSLAALAEIVVFVALGITLDLQHLSAATWRDGAVVVVLLALVIRPLVVWIALAGTRLERREKLFIAWSGLKGAVPILLAAFAVLGGVPGAEPVYGLGFVAVLLSVFGQGTFVPAVARRLGLASLAPEPTIAPQVAPRAAEHERTMKHPVRHGE